MSERLPLASRFRGFMPVVIDVECGGFNPNTDALLEIAAVLIELQPDGRLAPGESWRFHIQPFEGAKLEAASLAITGIDPFHPLRPAIQEKEALTKLFKEVRRAMKENE
ncbi:MAG: exonuclease domain-containing protein, partial [Steroidobacteraceae bacterium]